MTNPPLNLLLKQLRDPETDERPDAELLARVAHSRDADALEALIGRHASLVQGVCQRLLPCRADADDVFQATFLVLLRRAATLRSASSLGSWLHTTAYRLALRVLASSRRRYPLEAGREPHAGRDPLDEISGRELCAVIDEELQHLPEKYRAAVVLCCLENRSREEAARELGWGVGSVKARLQRGRELLRRRLERRGLALSTALLAPLLTRTSAPAALLPPARDFLAGQGTSLSARAVQLAGGAIAAPLRSLTACVLLLALVTAGAS
ncbi:MAG TPA: sigma-70 family RNA polymerase sigma factor, partial [Gemmataceae bacterium]|nr:sigma-70 family RNA polymerase sigma factor [Gemmataceae bacterium]